MYYGDELGMIDVPVPIEAQRDPQGLRGGESRDPERAPMRWDGSAAGRVHDGDAVAADWTGRWHGERRRTSATSRPSVLSLYRRLLELRRAEPALNVGEWQDLGHNEQAMAFLRTDGARRFLVAANLTSTPADLPPGASGLSGTLVLSTLDRHSGGLFHPGSGLAADEAIVVLLD